MNKFNKRELIREYCNGKIKYDKKGATTMMNFLERKGRKNLRIYDCPLCGGWHLTHKEEI